MIHRFLFCLFLFSLTASLAFSAQPAASNSDRNGETWVWDYNSDEGGDRPTWGWTSPTFRLSASAN